MADRILVFIPCYNCAAQIGRTIAQLDRLAAGTFAEVLVVDNGSRDRTVEVATTALDGVRQCPARIVRNSRNYNLGGSHKAAFAYAQAGGFSHVAVLHGDDQADIGDLAPVLLSGAHRTYDACLGARFMPGSSLHGYGRLRTLGNRGLNMLFSAISGVRVHDLGSGLNLFSRSVFADPAVALYADDLRFNIYLLLGCIDAQRRIRFFPIAWRDEDQISNVRMLSQSLLTLQIAWEYVFRRAYFRSGDHRREAHEAYRFDEVASSPRPAAA